MAKVEMRVTIQPGEIKQIVGDDGSMTIEGVDDPEFIRLLHAIDRFICMRQLQSPFNPHRGDPVEGQLVDHFKSITPRMKRLLREHPLAG